MGKPETLPGDERDIPFREVIGFANDHAGFALRPPVLDLLRRHPEVGPFPVAEASIPGLHLVQAQDPWTAAATSSWSHRYRKFRNSIEPSRISFFSP